MILRNIALDEDGNPTRVTFDMTVDEVAAIGKSFGGWSYSTMEQTFPNLDSSAHATIYDGACTFANKFWEDGIDAAARGEEADM